MAFESKGLEDLHPSELDLVALVLAPCAAELGNQMRMVIQLVDWVRAVLDHFADTEVVPFGIEAWEAFVMLNAHPALSSFVEGPPKSLPHTGPQLEHPEVQKATGAAAVDFEETMTKGNRDHLAFQELME